MGTQINKEKLSVYRPLLESERVELSERLAEFGEGGTGLNYDSNFADSSQVTAERGEVDRLILELKDALTLVDSALNKIEHGTYGICENCGAEISEARLEAKPSARYCIDCAGKVRPGKK
jgi:RNA polymerase-binding protein DksA